MIYFLCLYIDYIINYLYYNNYKFTKLIFYIFILIFLFLYYKN